MVSTDALTYNKSVDTLTGEASTLQWPALQAPRMFTLESHRTGRTVTMQLCHTSKDEEGDIICWDYKSPQIPTTCTIFND